MEKHDNYIPIIDFSNIAYLQYLKVNTYFVTDSYTPTRLYFKTSIGSTIVYGKLKWNDRGKSLIYPILTKIDHVPISLPKDYACYKVRLAKSIYIKPSYGYM